MEWMALLMFLSVIGVLLLGYPVAYSLAGTALAFALIGTATGSFDNVLGLLPERLTGIMKNQTLLAVPLFVFMGVMLERTQIAERLLSSMASLFGSRRAGLGISVTLVGMLLAASTGIVGATVVTMGLISLPTMIKRGYNPSVASGTICAAGTLGQIIPPSIVLVLLGDQLSNAYQLAQYSQNIFSPKTLSVGDLFVGALIPGLLLVGMYLIYLVLLAYVKPHWVPAMPEPAKGTHTSALVIESAKAMLPPLLLIVAVLGSIIGGLATPTEAAAVGAMGALLLGALNRQLSLQRLQEVMRSTVRVSSMVFMILIGASIFSLVFRGFHGDEAVHRILTHLPGGILSAMLVVMLVMFLLGFVLDFIEITFVVVPIVGPVLLQMGVDPIWLGVMIAINLQTSFLTPPFGFALFYLRGVAPASLTTRHIYAGVAPYILIQLIALLALALWPALATWLPRIIY